MKIKAMILIMESGRRVGRMYFDAPYGGFEKVFKKHMYSQIMEAAGQEEGVIWDGEEDGEEDK